jgi:hypothetical protein
MRHSSSKYCAALESESSSLCSPLFGISHSHYRLEKKYEVEKEMAEGTGLEPAYPFGRRFSRPQIGLGPDPTSTDFPI